MTAPYAFLPCPGLNICASIYDPTCVLLRTPLHLQPGLTQRLTSNTATNAEGPMPDGRGWHGLTTILHLGSPGLQHLSTYYHKPVWT